MSNRTSFESNFDPENAEYNKGTKLKPKKKKVPNIDRQKALDNAAKETTQKLEGHLQEAAELGQKFLKILNDTRLSENKGPIDQSVEKEVARQWQNYILRINNDHNEPEGMGSASALSLVLASLLKLRNRINNIEYEYSILKKENEELKNQVSALEKKNEGSSE